MPDFYIGLVKGITIMLPVVKKGSQPGTVFSGHGGNFTNCHLIFGSCLGNEIFVQPLILFACQDF